MLGALTQDATDQTLREADAAFDDLFHAYEALTYQHRISDRIESANSNTSRQPTSLVCN
jgi:hypothetical protein